MSVGEPDFNTPDHIKEAAKRLSTRTIPAILLSLGYADLRKAIVAKLKKEKRTDYSINEVLVSNGAKQRSGKHSDGACERRRRGDYTSTLLGQLSANGEIGRRKSNDCQCRFRPRLQNDACNWRPITPKTRMIIICSPSNPTGSVYPKDELGTGKRYQKSMMICLFWQTKYTSTSIISANTKVSPSSQEWRNVPSSSTAYPKAYAMTGWRIGYIAAQNGSCRLQQTARSIHERSMFGQSKAAEAAYTLEQGCVEDMRLAFERRRNLIVKLAKEIRTWGEHSTKELSICSRNAAVSSARVTVSVR